MTTPERLSAAQPIIRATVRSTLNRHSNLWDCAESAAMEAVWRDFQPHIGDLVRWTRKVALTSCIDVLRKAARKPEEVAEETSVAAQSTRSTGGIDLQLLSPRARAVANLLMASASKREIQDELRLTRKQLDAAIEEIKEIAKPA